MNNASQSTNKLCVDCQQFYANPANENLCSTCFKKKFKNQNTNNVVVQTKPKQIVTEDISQNIAASQVPPQALNIVQTQEILAEQTKLKQEDHTRCWSCKKKVNLLGIKCKCDFTFCNKHRMPEEHACEFDHATFGRDLIKTNNPLVQKAKIEKI